MKANIFRLFIGTILCVLKTEKYLVPTLYCYQYGQSFIHVIISHGFYYLPKYYVHCLTTLAMQIPFWRSVFSFWPNFWNVVIVKDIASELPGETLSRRVSVEMWKSRYKHIVYFDNWVTKIRKQYSRKICDNWYKKKSAK